MPELTPQQKAQLDKNIRGMLEQGASQEDVVSYANDFKLKYDSALKKKEGGGLSSIGAKVSYPTSKAPLLSGGSLSVEDNPVSEKQRLVDYMSGLKTPEEVQSKKTDIATAVSQSNPMVQVSGKSMYSPQKIDMEAKDRINETMYDNSDQWKDPIKNVTKKTLSQNAIPTTKDILVNNRANQIMQQSIAESGFHAKNLLLNSEWGKGGDDNETKRLLQNRVAQYEKTASPFRNSGINPTSYLAKDQIYDAAIKAYANQNETFKKQLEETGVDLNKPDIKLSMGDNNAKVGQIMNHVLQNPDLYDYLKNENPSLIPAIQEVQNNLIYDNKDYGVTQLANEISRDMQDKGYNKIDPIFNFEGAAKKTGDFTAESLFANDPKKLQLYRDNKESILNKLDAPSLFSGIAESSKGFGKGIINSFTEPFTSTSKTIKEGWEKEANHVSADPKGLVKFLSDSGHAIGFVASIAATGNVLGAAGMGANTASMISLGVGFLGDNLEQAKMKYPNSPVKQWTSALFNTGLYMAMGKSLFPAAKVEQALTKVQPGVSKGVENLASGKITRDAARAELNTWGKKAIEIAGDGLQKNIKVSAEMTGISILNKVLDKVMGMDDQTFQDFHPEGEEADTFKSMFLSNILVNGMAAYGQSKAKNNIAKESVYEAATYPNRYRDAIEAAAISKNVVETKDMLGNLDYVAGVKKDLDTRGLSEKQKKDYLFNALKSKVLNESKPSSPDATLNRQHTERVKELEEINQGILEGKDADEVVTTSEQKKIDEQDKNDTELERLTKAKELDQKEYDEKRGELDGRRPEDRIKIEKLEQAQKEKNEDYDKKIAKLTPKVEEPITLDQDRDLMDEGSEFESRPKEEILVDVPDAANGIADKGVREAFLTNPERGLAEVAQQLHSTTGEAETASNTYGNKIADLALELYPTRESADKALTPTPKGNTSNVGGDVETQYNERKKADIERRRQEELDNLFSRTQASTDKQLNTPVQKLSKEEINRNIETAKQQNKDLIEELEKEFKENTDNKASDEVWDKWDKKSDKLDNNLPQGVSFRITDGKVDLFDNQSYRESNFGGNRVTQVSVASLHRQTEKFEVGDRLQVQDGVRALPAEVTKVNENGKILEAKQEDGRIIISRGNIITLAPINDRLKINAKYDAELKALENKPTPSLPSNVSSEEVGSGVGGDVDVDKVYYHGTPNKDFNGEFDERKIGERDSGFIGRGFYFTEDKSIADQYQYKGGKEGKILERKLDIKNPLRLDKEHINPQELAKDVFKYIDEERQKKGKEPYRQEKREDDIAELTKKLTEAKHGTIVGRDLKEWIDISDYAKSRGHDAIIGSKEVVVFDKSQIKAVEQYLTTKKDKVVGSGVGGGKRLEPVEVDYSPEKNYESGTTKNVFRGYKSEDKVGRSTWWTGSKKQADVFANNGGQQGQVKNQKLDISKALRTKLILTSEYQLSDLSKALGLTEKEILGSLDNDYQKNRVEKGIEKAHTILENPKIQKLLRDNGYNMIEATENHGVKTTSKSYLVFNESLPTQEVKANKQTQGESAQPKEETVTPEETFPEGKATPTEPIQEGRGVGKGVLGERTDRSGNEIGDGSYHSDHTVVDLKDYPKVRVGVSKSDNTESVYVTYNNEENGKSITVRFSNHENNATKFGNQLDGNKATKDEILYHLGLKDREFIPHKKLSINQRQVAKKDLQNYEEADKTIKELYDLGAGADISKYKGKLAKGSNYLILGDEVVEEVQQRLNAFGTPVSVGKYIYKDKKSESLLSKEQSLSKQESGGKAPVTKPEGKSDVVGNQQKVETKRVEKVAELEAERDMAILREGKPEVKMEFVTAKELVDSKDPIANKKTHDDIKDRYKKMRELLDCLWQKK